MLFFLTRFLPHLEFRMDGGTSAPPSAQVGRYVGHETEAYGKRKNDN